MGFFSSLFNNLPDIALGAGAGFLTGGGPGAVAGGLGSFFGAQANDKAQGRFDALQSQAGGFIDRSRLSSEQAQQLAGKLGTDARQRLADQTQQQLGASEQNLTSRGLGNTTIRSNQRRGINAQAGRQRIAIDEAVTGQQLNLLNQQANREIQLGQFGVDTALSRSDEPFSAGGLASIFQNTGGNSPLDRLFGQGQTEQGGRGFFGGFGSFGGRSGDTQASEQARLTQFMNTQFGS